MDKENKETKLYQILMLLSKNKIDPEKIKEDLKDLYDIKDGEASYRHLYSDVFSKIVMIDEKSNSKDVGDEEYSLASLNDNLKNLYKSMESDQEGISDKNILKDNKALLKSVKKLYDHVALDIARLDYLTKVTQETRDEILKSATKIFQAKKDLKNNIDDTNQKIEKVKSDLKNHRFDVMGITTLVLTAFTMVSVNLTVFSGVVSNNIPLNKIILLFSLLNAIIISSVFCIYSIIRKVHGDINALILYIIIFLDIVFIGCLGCYGFSKL